MTEHDGLWYPPRDLVDSANVTLFMDKLSLKSYREFVSKSTRELEWFWGSLPEWLEVELSLIHI